MAVPSRILFVDDEAQLLDSFRFALRRQREQWEVHTAISGERAVAELATAAFDVVVSDMRMPGMDGSVLLRHVREVQPDAVRLMLSADAGQDALLRTIPVAHQYLSKPCGMGELRTLLERIWTLRALVGDPVLRRLGGELQTVPSLPGLFAELERVLADPASMAADASRVIERDPGLATKVLQLASSGFFGDGHTVTRIPEAVSILGLQLLRTLLPVPGVFDRAGAQLEGFDPRRLQARSRMVATLSAQIVGPGPQSDVAFLAGLLRDIGQQVLAVRLPGPFARALALARETRRPLHQVEQEVFGSDHAVLGGYILGIWGLPQAVVDVVTHHHQSERFISERLDALSALQIAGALLAEAWAEAEGDAAGEHLSPSLLALAGVEERLPAWRVAARTMVAAR